MGNSSQIEEIKRMLDELKYKCYLAKCPIAAVFQFRSSDGKEHRTNTVLTPQAVDYNGDTGVFYDITNVMNGNFKTVMTSEFPEDDDGDETTFFG